MAHGEQYKNSCNTCLCDDGKGKCTKNLCPKACKVLVDTAVSFSRSYFPTYIHVTWLGLLTSVSRLSLLHHSRYNVVPSVAITFGHKPAA